MDTAAFNKIFKAYDIRGTTNELSEDFFYKLGIAFVQRFKPQKVAVGRDFRPESVDFTKALVSGLLDAGCDVANIGEIATEMLYFTVGNYNKSINGGLVVTASHNPQGWNGCKIVTQDAFPVGLNNGLSDIRDIIIKNELKKIKGNPGKYENMDIFEEYKEKVLSFLEDTDISNLNIIIDAGNGIGGKIYDKIFGDLDISVKRMYFEPDGTFPNHNPDPSVEENVSELKNRVKTERFDFGISIDGDADRAFFIDKKGRHADGAYFGAIIAKYLLKNSTNRKIVHDTRVIWPMLKETIKAGGTPVESRDGRSYFKQKLKQEDALFGAELSGHCYYKDFYYSDSGMITIALIFKMISEGIDFVKELDYMFENYPTSGEVNYEISDFNSLISKLIKYYKNDSPKISEIDGLSIEFNNWRFNIRKSNTQELVRLNVESTSKDIVIEKFREVENFINKPRLNTPALSELQ